MEKLIDPSGQFMTQQIARLQQSALELNLTTTTLEAKLEISNQFRTLGLHVTPGVHPTKIVGALLQGSQLPEGFSTWDDPRIPIELLSEYLNTLQTHLSFFIGVCNRRAVKNQKVPATSKLVPTGITALDSKLALENAAKSTVLLKTLSAEDKKIEKMRKALLAAGLSAEQVETTIKEANIRGKLREAK